MLGPNSLPPFLFGPPTHDVKEITMAKEMDQYEAVMIAEGVMETTEETYLAAWQQLHDTGLAYQLQGWFGRMAQALIGEGKIHG
jgi:hypothetical protein